MRVLVIGGTGNVGAATLAALAEMGVDAVGAARRPGPGGIALDLTQPDTVRDAARGFDAAFLNTPLGRDETAVGLAALAALNDAEVGRIVYMAVMHPHAMAEIPHVATKLHIRDAVLANGGTVIEPCFFFQNDLFVLDAIRFGGVYPMPVGNAGLSAVDVGDIGRACANALLGGWEGKAVPVCGEEVLSAHDFARAWADALGRPVVYPGDAVEPFIGALSKVYPGFDDWVANDFATMMRVTQRLGCAASPDEVTASRAIIGRTPRRHAAFVADTLANLEGPKP